MLFGMRRKEKDAAASMAGAREEAAPAGRAALPRGLRKFYDAYDPKFKRESREWLGEFFEAWAGQRVAENEAKWQERTQLIVDHTRKTEAAIAALAKERESLGAAASETKKGLVDLALKVAALEAKASTGPDPETLRRLKEIEVRLTAAEALAGGGSDAEQHPSPAPPKRHTLKRHWPKTEPEPEPECCDGEGEECCGDSEDAVHSEEENRRTPRFVQHDTRPARSKAAVARAEEASGPQSAVIRKMLDEAADHCAAENKTLRVDIGILMEEVVAAEGEVWKGDLLAELKAHGQRATPLDIDSAAKGLGYLPFKDEEGRTFFVPRPRKNRNAETVGGE